MGRKDCDTHHKTQSGYSTIQLRGTSHLPTPRFSQGVKSWDPTSSAFLLGLYYFLNIVDYLIKDGGKGRQDGNLPKTYEGNTANSTRPENGLKTTE